jgi:UDP-N-acetylmuramate: L-alanyl-gamma-D-glutamyl-meso-diaminopimelate ligase
MTTFAHHPTAIATTLGGLRKKVGKAPHHCRDRAALEYHAPRCAQGQSGAVRASDADEVIWYQPAGLNWDLGPVVAASTVPSVVLDSIDAIIAKIVGEARPGDQVLIMSNGGFGGIHRKLVQALDG